MKERKLRLSDQQRIEGIKRNNQRVIAECYEAFIPLAFKIVLDNSGSRENAENIHQEAFMLFLEKIWSGTYKHKAKLSSYYYKIVHFSWLKWLRTHGKEIPNSLDTMQYEGEAVETTIEEDNNCIETVKEIMGEELNENQKEVVIQFYLGEANMKDIAEELGYTNDKNAKNQKSRAMTKLKEKVKASRLTIEDCL